MLSNKGWHLKIILAILIILLSFYYSHEADKHTNPPLTWCLLQPEKYTGTRIWTGETKVISATLDKFTIIAGEKEVTIRGNAGSIKDGDSVSFVGIFRGDHIELVKLKKIEAYKFSREIMNIVSITVLIYIIFLIYKRFKFSFPTVKNG